MEDHLAQPAGNASNAAHGVGGCLCCKGEFLAYVQLVDHQVSRSIYGLTFTWVKVRPTAVLFLGFSFLFFYLKDRSDTCFLQILRNTQ